MNKTYNNPQKLTKRYFEDLPAGVVLVSNCLRADMRPVFMERVAAAGERRPQWKRIVRAGANQRLCRTFDHVGDVSHWMDEALRPSGTADGDAAGPEDTVHAFADANESNVQGGF